MTMCISNLLVDDSEMKKKNLSFTSFACSSSQGVCALLEIGPFVLSQRMKEKDLGGKNGLNIGPLGSRSRRQNSFCNQYFLRSFFLNVV